MTLKSFPQAKALLPEGTHIEHREGPIRSAMIYCEKDGSVTSRGIRPRSIKTRWQIMIEQAKKGDLKTLAEQFPSAYVRYYRTWRDIAKDNSLRPADATTPLHQCNTWIYGPSGAGKTVLAKKKSDFYFFKNSKGIATL